MAIYCHPIYQTPRLDSPMQPVSSRLGSLTKNTLGNNLVEAELWVHVRDVLTNDRCQIGDS